MRWYQVILAASMMLVFAVDARADQEEVEPNDDPAHANVIDIHLLDQLIGSIDPAGDQDWFEFTAYEGECARFETGPGDPFGDTKLDLYAGDGTTLMASDDDGGVGYYSRLEYVFPAYGTYYIVVTGYQATTIVGQYVLTVMPPPPTEEFQGAETCHPGICLEPSPGRIVMGDTSNHYDDYDPRLPDGTSCTHSTFGNYAHGPDVVYEIGLAAGATLTATLDTYCGQPINWSLYLVTDCQDMSTCVAGSDYGNPEAITWSHTGAPRLYYLIVDGFSSYSRGQYVLSYSHDGVGCDNAIAVERSTWGSVKTRYR